MEIENFTKTRLYRVYQGMKSRCYNQNATAYAHYGGRGIKICDEWMGREGSLRFADWALSHGYADNLTIDRIDVDGGYCPENCRWITRSENSRRAYSKAAIEKSKKANNTSANEHTSKRKAEWQNNYIRRTYDRVNLLLLKGQKDAIKAAADAKGQSVNQYIQDAIAAQMEQDAQK